MGWCLISFLGTSDYRLTKYKLEHSAEYETIFVQEAILNVYKNILNNECLDIRIMSTKEANEKHGKALKDRLEAQYKNINYKAIDIKAFSNEEEMWALFNKLYEAMPEKANIILDVTHGFRSMPMLANSILSYVKLLKDIKLQAILYGAYEAQENGITPIIDISGLYRVMRWGSAVENFYKRGIAEDIYALAENELRPVFKSGVYDRAAQYEKQLSNNLKKIGEFLSASRGISIYEGAEMLQARKALDELKKSQTYVAALRPLYELIKERLSLFKEKSSSNILVAVDLCIAYKLVQQGFSLLQEGIITIILELHNFKDIVKRENREAVNRMLQYIANPSEKYGNPVFDDKYKHVSQAIENSNFATSIAKDFDSLKEYRNNINHAGFNEKAFSFGKLNTCLEGKFKTILLAIINEKDYLCDKTLIDTAQSILDARAWIEDFDCNDRL